MSQHFDIAILGVDTLGGETLLELLEEREFPVAMNGGLSGTWNGTQQTGDQGVVVEVVRDGLIAGD